jgi:hypothetical protein
MLKLMLALALTALPAVAQSPNAPYSSWMLPHTPGFDKSLRSPLNVTANLQMTVGNPVLFVSCASCTLTLPACSAGTVFQLIPGYLINPAPANTVGPSIVPAGADTWTIGASGSQPGANFSRSVPPFWPSEVLAIGTPGGCEWALTGL